MTEPAEPEATPPRGLLEDFDDLLKRPRARLAADKAHSLARFARMLAGSAACWMLYGAVIGCFQGGGQIPLAAFKAVLIVASSLLLCAPSLYVFATLLGADLSGRRFLALLAGFGGTLGLLLLGLLPIGWLFSVSSASLAFVAWLHLWLWLLALVFAARFLGQALNEAGAHGAVVLWVGLFCVVAFQVTTLLRPVLWREPGTAAFAETRMFFMEAFGQVTQNSRASPLGSDADATRSK